MAERNPYLPRTLAALLGWLQNFASKFAGYGPTLGFTAAEVTAITDDFNMFQYTMAAWDTFKAWLQDLNKFREILSNAPIGTPMPAFPAVPVLGVAPAAVPSGIFRRIANTVQRIKAHPNYAANIGEDLQIIGSEVVIDPNMLKPLLKGALDGVRPLIKWKKEHADSINLYVDRRDGQGFRFLAHDTIPDYIDTNEIPAGANSAVWDYKGRYLIGDDEVGAFSDVITITATRQI